MGVTVREAMRIGGLVKCKVVAGEAGLDREIDYITVMEVPDVIQWLKGNDLLLTSLYPIKDDPEAIRKLVQQLNEVGSSALAIKAHRYVEEIPKEILEAGNRLRLPIIEIHNEVSYLDIMTPLMEIMLKKADPGKEQLEAFFQWMTELAMGGKGIPALIDALQQVAENQITIESETSLLESISASKPVSPLSRKQKNELKAAKRSIRMDRQLQHKMTPCIVTPLLLNDELYGYLTCWQTKREFLQQDFNILDRCVPLVALEFLKVITKMEVEQTFKDDFLSEVLTGSLKDPWEIVEKGRTFGWDLNQNYQVLAIAFQHASSQKDMLHDAVWLQEWKRKLLRKVTDMFRYNSQPVLVTVRKEHIVVLYPLEDATQKQQMLQLAESIRKQLSADFEDLAFTVGIGRFYADLAGIHQGYSDAVQAIRLGKPISGESGCVHYDDLGLFRILSQFQDRRELEQLYSETVGKLAVYDGNNNANLLATLTEYFSNNCALAETADKMFVHVNTMKYRLQKIEQLTGCSVHHAEHRLMLHVGLKIHQLLLADRL